MGKVNFPKHKQWVEKPSVSNFGIYTTVPLMLHWLVQQECLQARSSFRGLCLSFIFCRKRASQEDSGMLWGWLAKMIHMCKSLGPTRLYTSSMLSAQPCRRQHRTRQKQDAECQKRTSWTQNWSRSEKELGNMKITTRRKDGSVGPVEMAAEAIQTGFRCRNFGVLVRVKRKSGVEESVRVWTSGDGSQSYTRIKVRGMM